MRIAVTGAHGYIGSRLSAALVAAGAEVHTFTRQRPVLRPGGSLSPELPGDQVLFHLASSVGPASAEGHPAQVAADHDLFARLLDQIARLDRPPLVVLASSGVYVYDPGAGLPFREGSPLVPRTAYGKAKLQLEHELRDRRDSVPGVALRLATVYGPGQPADPGRGVIAHWLRAALVGSPVRLFGQPSTLRDFVYVGDVVAAMCRIAALASAPLPEALNIGSGRATSLDQLLCALRLVVGDVSVERVEDRGFDRYDAQLDVRLAASALGWIPRTTLEAGLVRTWQALTQQVPA
jgi:UDP-glucose 4-epimerase